MSTACITDWVFDSCFSRSSFSLRDAGVYHFVFVIRRGLYTFFDGISDTNIFRCIFRVFRCRLHKCGAIQTISRKKTFSGPSNQVVGSPGNKG